MRWEQPECRRPCKWVRPKRRLRLDAQGDLIETTVTKCDQRVERTDPFMERRILVDMDGIRDVGAFRELSSADQFVNQLADFGIFHTASPNLFDRRIELGRRKSVHLHGRHPWPSPTTF